MTEQEYVRKYMLKDIVKRNLHFIWLIVLCMALFAGGLGYKKYSEYQKRFANMALKGTMKQYSADYYSGNVKGETLQMRAQTLIAVMTSRENYSEFISLSGYNLTYDTFLDMVICGNDGTKDCVTAVMQYPYGVDGFSVIDDEQAVEFMNYYMQAVENTCNSILGKGSVSLLGMSDLSVVTHEATDEQRAMANKAIIKNAFIGAAIGFIIPVVIITIIYLLAGRLRTPQEIAYCSGLKLLAQVRNGSPEELGRAELYITHRFGDKPHRINLITIGGGGEHIGEALRQCFEISGSVVPEILVTQVSEDNTDAYKTAFDCDVNILVAGAGKVREEDINKVIRTLSLYDIEGCGVIVYESGR